MSVQLVLSAAAGGRTELALQMIRESYSTRKIKPCAGDHGRPSAGKCF